MKNLAWELALIGLVAFGTAGCNADDSDTDVVDTNDDTDVPANETDCDDGDDEDQDGAEDCEDSDCADSEDCLFVPSFIAASGAFAYDATNDKVVSAIVGGQAAPPFIQIFIANADYETTGDDSDACTINLTYTGTADLALETWDNDDGSYAGFIMPEGEYDVETDCENLAPDFGTAEDLASSGWGVGLGPEAADLDLSEVLDQSGVPESEWVYYAGGGFYWGMEGVPTEFSNFGYTTAIQIDADGNLLNGDGEIASTSDLQANDLALIEAADFVTDSGLPPTGYYSVGFLGGWSFAQ